jgi:uncharacterized protein (TIGR01777 family)
MPMTKKILITGGSGLIGEKLTELLVQNNYTVAHLTRNPEKSKIKAFRWNPYKNEIDPEAITFADIIVHLAGENISNGRWTHDQKMNIIKSRVSTTKLLFNTIKERNKKLEAFISASAIGFYGSYTSETIFHEALPAGIDFLAETVNLWEDAVSEFETLNIRTVKIRIGVVLSNNGGALPKLIKTVKTGFGSAIGTGKQFIPWIHIDDLTHLFKFMIEQEDLWGIYNAVAPEHVTNKEFMRVLAKIMNKPFIFPNIPSFVMKLKFGEMSIILLEGSRVSSEKIQKAGFRFNYPDLKSALIKID